MKLLGLICLLLLVGCTEEYGPTVEDEIGGSWTSITYKGHQYLIHDLPNSAYDTGTTLHDPDCSCGDE